MPLLLLNKKKTDVQLLENPLDYNSTPFVEDFNCGGFALQTLDWYIPYAWREHGYIIEDDKDLSDLLEDCTSDIIMDFEEQYHNSYSLSVVSDYKQVPIGTEVIGFRFAYYENEDYDEDEEPFLYHLDDFHFVWRDKKGHWWDKPGYEEVKPFNQRDLYEDWNGRYNGEIVWFAKLKRSKA